jgi:23S rRNA (cytosine1962-C5)-methyltransferase
MSGLDAERCPARFDFYDQTMKRKHQPELILLSSPDWQDYELVDSGAGSKLERFGQYRFVRPEAQAIWQPTLSQREWQAAHGAFVASDGQEGGRWRLRDDLPERWIMQYKDLRFWAQPTPFRHMGLFPEQANHWDWMRHLITEARRPTRVLNLFGYTGIASLAAAAAGASVTHVDASKKTNGWARENQLLSGLEERPIRWILDDALKFVRREVRREARYDGFIVDPPPFGRGPKGEIWRLEESLPALLNECRALFSDRPLFFVLTAYAIRTSALSLFYALDEILGDRRGVIATGEMVIEERSAGHVLSTAIFARWTAESV